MDPVTITAGVGWGISILGWVVSPVMSKLVSKGWSYLQDVAGSSAKDLEEKVEELKLMLEAARVSPDDEKKLERWVKKLKSAFYDAEDILDAIDYHRLECKAMHRRQSNNTTKKMATPKDDSKLPPGSKDKLTKTLKEIEKLINDAKKLLPPVPVRDNIKSSPQQTTGSGSLSKTTSRPPKVFGRDEDAKKIISMLHGGDTAADDHSVIGIHGISGSGKTTLVQYVCECLKKKNNGVPYFDLIMWIHVTKNFSLHTVYSEMLEIASGQVGRHISLDKLETDLQDSLKSKRFLLVLDDVWYSESVDKQNDLQKLLSPLKEADKGSRVLVTSRTADAVKLLGAQNPMPISDMDEEELFKMFMHYSFDKSPVKDQDKGKFETIGRKISRLLRKSPLAARTVAGQLRIRTRRAEDIDFWIDTLNRKRDLLKDTMGALWWSYQQLDEHVRQCFAYCSMFPRRYELTQDELVHMWMAQGFVDTSKYSDVESAAHECFEVLLSASFIQPKHESDGYQYYKVHDLLHDLAATVAGSDCFTIEDDLVDHQIPQDVRHLFINSTNLVDFEEQIVKLDSLRTLTMSGSASATKITAEEFKRMLKDLKKLRFVHVWMEKFGEDVIPECIGELKHLRYLGLTGVSSDAPSDREIVLPPTFTKLYHLQEISLPCAWRFSDDIHMADLENLRRIDLHGSIRDIGQMPWLQTMRSFTVKKEKGYEITQLENLNNIRGELSIYGLGNIQTKEEARRANLRNKLHVKNLHLDWRSYEDEGTESSSRKKQKTAAGHPHQEATPEPEEILKALQPPPLLVELSIDNYSGSTFPSWLSGDELKHLEELTFYDCFGSGSQFKFIKPLPKLHKLEIFTCSWNTLPDNIKQLASLEVLSIRDCPNIQSLPELPPSLKKLQITECKNINKALPELPPSLEELVIYDCKDIQSAPGLPSSLKKLEIEGSQNISTVPELPPSLEELIICDFGNIHPPPRLPSSLKKLQIEGCPNISTLLELPPSLEKLIISNCKNIHPPPRLPSSLKKLKIGGCPNISTLLELSPSLKKLEIEDCQNIQSLPGLPSSLKRLQIKRCPKIKKLPNLPPSLMELYCRRALADKYPDRQAIVRIKDKMWY